MHIMWDARDSNAASALDATSVRPPPPPLLPVRVSVQQASPMSEGAWIVSAFKQESKAYGSKEAAERAAAKIGGVAWWCEGIEPPAKVPQPCVLVPRTGERVVERVLGHLGLRTATTGEIARTAITAASGM